MPREGATLLRSRDLVKVNGLFSHSKMDVILLGRDGEKDEAHASGGRLVFVRSVRL